MRSTTAAVRLGVITGSLAALLTIPLYVATADSDEAFRKCGGNDRSNVAMADFTIAAARDIWLEFPAMLRAPELEDVAAPARVIVFKPGFNLAEVAVLGFGSPPTDVDTAICVIQEDGSSRLYTNVSKQGSQFAGTP